jgi:L-ascorbate peroxidase
MQASLLRDPVKGGEQPRSMHKAVLVASVAAGILLLCLGLAAQPQDITDKFGDQHQSDGTSVDELFDWTPKEHADLGDTTLGKIGNLAVPASRASRLSASPSSLRHRLRMPFQLEGGFRPVPNVRAPAHGLSEENMARVETAVSPLAADGLSRRSALGLAMWLAFGMSGTEPARAIPFIGGDSLRKQKADQIEAVLKESKKLDGISFQAMLRLVVHDAITSESASLDGSIRFSEELKRPENAGLAPVVSTLEGVQKELSEATGLEITFADTEAYAMQAIAFRQFKDDLCASIGKDQSVMGCDDYVKQFGTLPRTLSLGRRDASKPVTGDMPWVGKSATEVKETFKSLGFSVWDICCLAPGFFETEAKGVEFLMQDEECAIKLGEIDRSQKTKTKSNYQASFFDAVQKLANTGTARDDTIYCTPEALQAAGNAKCSWYD